MKNKNFKEYGIEILLTVLKIASTQLDKLKEIGDLSGAEILESSVIIPYEKIYGLLLETDVEKISNEELEKLKTIVEQIREKNKIKNSIIENNIKIRKELKENSGAKTVEKFFKYNLKKLNDKKSIIKEKYLEYYDKEEKLENLLKDTIQEKDQFDIINELHPIRENLSRLEREYLKNEEKIAMFEKKIESKWTYEIYGLISEAELLKTYKDVFKMEE